MNATLTWRQARLVRTFEVVAERGLPRPSLRTLAKLAGYRGPQGAHNNIVRLTKRGAIPAGWWPRRGMHQ